MSKLRILTGLLATTLAMGLAATPAAMSQPPSPATTNPTTITSTAVTAGPVVSGPSGKYEIVSRVNVRTQPSTSGTIVRKFYAGRIVTATPMSNGWMRVSIEGKYRYYHGAYDRKHSENSSSEVIRHVRDDRDRFPDVFSRKSTDPRYDVHYVPSGGMVRGVVEGSWFKLGPNLYTPMSNLTTAHTAYNGTNGRAYPSQLCNMENNPGHRHILLACTASSDMNRLNAAFREHFGHDLEWDECYRTYDTQVSYRSWFGTKAAKPGYSNHGNISGQACDVRESGSRYGFGTEREQWLETNAHRYNFDRPSWADQGGRNPEYWHYESTR